MPDLNIENFVKLRARIAAEPDSAFYMPAFIAADEKGCGTAACIAGFCGMIIFDQKFSTPHTVVADNISDRVGDNAADGIYHLPDRAQEFLGLTKSQADELFYYHSWDILLDRDDWSAPEKKDALNLLDKIIETGEFHAWESVRGAED